MANSISTLGDMLLRRYVVDYIAQMSNTEEIWSYQSLASNEAAKYLGDGIFYYDALEENCFLHNCIGTTGIDGDFKYVWRKLRPGQTECHKCHLKYPEHIQLMVKLNG